MLSRDGIAFERMTPLDSLQHRIGHRFADPRLLERALTHRSAGADHNERLEFLGDAVLDLIVSAPRGKPTARVHSCHCN